MKLLKTAVAAGRQLVKVSGDPALKIHKLSWEHCQNVQLPSRRSVKKIELGSSVQNTNRFGWFFFSRFSKWVFGTSSQGDRRKLWHWCLLSGWEAGLLTFLAPSFLLGMFLTWPQSRGPEPTVSYCRSEWEHSSSVPLLIWNSPWIHFQPNRKWRQKSRGWFSSMYDQILLWLGWHQLLLKLLHWRVWSCSGLTERTVGCFQGPSWAQLVTRIPFSRLPLLIAW